MIANTQPGKQCNTLTSHDQGHPAPASWQTDKITPLQQSAEIDMATTKTMETYSVLVGQFQDVCPNHNKGSWRSIRQVMHNKSEESPHKQNTTSSSRHMFKLDVNIHMHTYGV